MKIGSMKIGSVFLPGVVGVLAFAAGGCHDEVLTPSITPPLSDPTAPFEKIDFPVVSRAATVYDRVSTHHFPNGAISRYVLYADSTVALEYIVPVYGYGVYRGRYSRTGSTITFRFNNQPGPEWQATGFARGDSLFVFYNIYMALSDFEDGEYVRAPRVRPSQTADEGEIHIAGADGSDITFLARGGSPAWSPVGDRVAFHRDARIHVINADGSGEADLGPGILPTWSPDGRLAFVDGEGITVMHGDGSWATTLVRNESWDWDWDENATLYPSWSPTGHHIAFTVLGNLDALVYVVDADGSELRLIYGRGFSPSWSPDGTRIVFWTLDGLAKIATAGGMPIQIDPARGGTDRMSKPAWSPDGATIAFTGWNGIWTLPANGGIADLLIPNAMHPSWSPDGSMIAFERRDE